MKAVCLLACLALARANIFHQRHANKMVRLDMLPSEHSNQYLNHGRSIEEHQRPHDHSEEDRHQNKDQKGHHENRHGYRPYPKEQPMKRYADSMEDNFYQNKQELTSYAKAVNSVEEYNAPMYADKDTPAVALSAMQPELFGDAIAWKGLKMAVGPASLVQSPKDIKKIYVEAQKAMKHIQDPETKAQLHQALDVAIQNEDQDSLKNATQLLKENQYSMEEHSIKTEDGYFLTLFRILPKKQPRDVAQRPVVFLMHGLLGSADDWLLMGPGKSLAYLLSDAGYDVWLGNARSSKYSHHVNKHPALSDYWQFSNDEIALYDLPVMMDFVLETSQQQKMFYVGQALGTTAFFALAAARPEYNNKIVMMYALSPMAYMSKVRSPMVRMIALNHHIHGQFRPNKEAVASYGGAMCKNEIGCNHLCSNAYVVMAGINVQDMNVSLIPSIMRHLPAGGSARQMLQYAQSFSTRDFRMFDFGRVINQEVYGQSQPPKYDMEKVTAPVTLYYSEHDWLAHPKDVERLQNELPNMSEAYKIPEKYFSHVNFLFSKKAPEVLYKRLIDSIEKHHSN